MRRPQGYATISGPDKVVECDTFTCAHCQRIVHIPPRCDPANIGGHCRLCDGLICPSCVGKGCTPWERKMEEAERREALRAAL